MEWEDMGTRGGEGRSLVECMFAMCDGSWLC